MMKRTKKVILTGMLSLAMFSGSITPYMGNTMIVAHAAELSQSSRWVGEGETWRVSDGSGSYLSNCWFQDDITKEWYLLGAGEDNTIMFSGLVTDQATGKTYLLNPNHDGTFGKMLTADGTYNINGQSIYLSFNQSHDGSYGAIISGLSDVRNTGITEKQLASIPSDSNTADTSIEVKEPEKPAEAPKGDGYIPGSNLDWGDRKMEGRTNGGGYVEWR